MADLNDQVVAFLQELSLSKLLSYGILAGSFMLKVPQIMKILQSGSAKGLTLSMFVLEAIAYAITIAYHYQNGYPFFTYGESVIIIFQIWVINFLIIYHQNLLLNFYIVVGTFLYMGTFLAMVGGFFGPNFLQAAQSAGVFITIASRLPQIYANFKNRGVGTLSAATVFLSFAGGAARVYTTLKDVADVTVLFGYSTATFLNLVMLLQCLIYGPGAVAATTKTTKKDNKKSQ